MQSLHIDRRFEHHQAGLLVMTVQNVRDARLEGRHRAQTWLRDAVELHTFRRLCRQSHPGIDHDMHVRGIRHPESVHLAGAQATQPTAQLDRPYRGFRRERVGIPAPRDPAQSSLRHEFGQLLRLDPLKLELRPRIRTRVDHAVDIASLGDAPPRPGRRLWTTRGSLDGQESSRSSPTSCASASLLHVDRSQAPRWRRRSRSAARLHSRRAHTRRFRLHRARRRGADQPPRSSCHDTARQACRGLLAGHRVREPSRADGTAHRQLSPGQRTPGPQPPPQPVSHRGAAQVEGDV